ncbi:MAG: YigZ family protein, partial [Clostridia bacterium]|nr:YigZ family protein [Clostridia bacterium]
MGGGITTLGGEGTGEYEEKRSRFIGYARPVKSAGEAAAFISEIRKKHSDARHNVYAYRIGENVTGYSDDGEPKGTGGLPVLGLLQKSDITDAAIVVTRYFGGILLGTGGLVRAYTEAAQAAVRAAGVVTLVPFEIISVGVSYGLHQAAARLISQFPSATLLGTSFGEDVAIETAVGSESVEEFLAAL